MFIATSLDGFIARRDGSLDFLDRVQVAGEDYGYQAFFDSVDALIVGRKTYDTACGFDAWPWTGKRVVVMTNRALDDDRVETAAGDAAAVVARLAKEGVRRAYVDGGSVIRAFLAAGLIDELTLSVVPVLVGEGVRLFEGLGGDVGLEADGAEAFASGLVQLRYRVRRAASA